MLIPKPKYLINGNVTQINIEQLKLDNIKAIIFDLDSTIMEPHSAQLNQSVAQFLDLLKPDFKLAVLTNNKNLNYLERVKEVLDLPIIPHARKPSQAGFLKIQSMFDLDPQNILVVGDRPITDIWGGYLVKMPTCLVNPLQIEPKWLTLLRNLERALIKKN